MVHVGDHHEHDVAGAARVGIHTVWVNYRGAPYPGEERPSEEIRSIAELPAALARIAGRPRRG
jgi:putative hydrolase of the HAD superfamily